MKVIIISACNPVRAYSGLKYLTSALKEQGMEVELMAKIPTNMLWETDNWGIKVKSFYSQWYGRIPLFRRYMAYIHVILLGLFTNSTIIFHELAFFEQMLILKKFLPKKKLIHYCTELYTVEDEPTHKRILDIYEKNASMPDLIIECEENRAELRKEMFNITTKTVVIPNTLPLTEIPKKTQSGALAKLAGVEGFPEGVPIVIYTGGAFFHRQLDIIIDAVSQVKGDVFFLAFLYGEKEAIEELRKICGEKLKKGMFKMCDAVPRHLLMECIHEATAGIVYYKPSLSIGNLYASPTKLFEYIGAGVPVISSNNPGIVDLVNKYNLGTCVEDESVEALTKAIEELVFDKEKIAKIRESEERNFIEKLCYEKSSEAAINEIKKIVAKEV